MTLWSARVGSQLDPAVWDFLRGDDAELLPYDLRATLQHAERLHAAGILDDQELAEVAEKLAEKILLQLFCGFLSGLRVLRGFP